MSIIDKVKNSIEKNCLINKGESVLVALSGGSDSIAMLHILFILSKELGFSLYCAHINHNIREEAENDEDFVRSYCKSLGVECFVKSADVLSYSKEKSISTELAGRKIRYDFFDEVMKKHSIDKLATAHNRNDSAESIILHLTRGCGLEGMCGIPVIRDGYIIRPIIDLNKKEIEEYCKNNQLSFVVDKSNFETDYTRNKIRLNIIPMIEDSINPKFVDTVTNNSQIFKEATSFINNYTKKIYDKIAISGKLYLSELLKEDEIIIKNVILTHFKNYTKTPQNLQQLHINEIVKHIKKEIAPKSINLPDGITAQIEYGTLYFEKTKKENVIFEYEISPGIELFIPECEMSVLIKEEKEIKNNTKDKIYFYIREGKEFKVRNRRTGDRFFPCGMNGTKKLSDFFTDLKIPVFKRELTPILTYDDDIVWVVGKRADRRFCFGEKLMSAEVTERRGN